MKGTFREFSSYLTVDTRADVERYKIPKDHYVTYDGREIISNAIVVEYGDHAVFCLDEYATFVDINTVRDWRLYKREQIV